MIDAAQAQPPMKLPAYVVEWASARVQVRTTRGVEQGYVAKARKVRNVDHMTLILHVLIDDGPLWIGNATEVVRLAERTTRHQELDSNGQPPG